MLLAKNKYNKNMIIALAPRGVCYTPNCMPPLWPSFKVVLTGMQILVNYACCQWCLLHDTNAIQAVPHTPQIILPPKFLQAYCTIQFLN
jgi:hypothetical protein